MITITKRLEFDYGHRVLGHEGKCRHLHGHRGLAEITVYSLTGLDSLGRVVDFSVLKSIVGKWVEDNWDHNLLLNSEDPLLSAGDMEEVAYWNRRNAIFGGREPYLFEKGNPTAENMAAKLYYVTERELLDRGFKVTRVKLFETPTSWAEYSRGLND
jgi:6-pyruvoyltetrahydropterin/6-carboxytetrahydropterin synthase